MTREGEIITACKGFLAAYPNIDQAGLSIGFLDGAVWSDKHPVNVEHDAMEKDKVLISSEELKYLEACEAALYYYHRNVRLCPVCGKGMLCDGCICTHCDYDDSYSVEEWKQTHKNESIFLED